MIQPARRPAFLRPTDGNVGLVEFAVRGPAGERYAAVADLDAVQQRGDTLQKHVTVAERERRGESLDHLHLRIGERERCAGNWRFLTVVA